MKLVRAMKIVGSKAIDGTLHADPHKSIQLDLGANAKTKLAVMRHPLVIHFHPKPRYIQKCLNITSLVPAYFPVFPVGILKSTAGCPC